MHHDEEDKLEEHEDQRCYDGRTDDTLLPAPPPAIGDGRLLVGRERRRTSRACRGLWGGRLKAGCGLKEVSEQFNVFVCVRLQLYIRAHVHVCAVRCALRAPGIIAHGSVSAHRVGVHEWVAPCGISMHRALAQSCSAHTFGDESAWTASM